MKKIMHIVTGLGRGGAENVLHQLVKECDNDIENLIVSLKKKQSLSHDMINSGIRVIHLNISGFFTAIPAIFQIIKLIKKYKPNIITSWMYHANLVALIGKLVSKKSSIIWNIRSCCYPSVEILRTRWVIWLNKCFSKIPNKIIYNSRLSRMNHEKYGFISTSSYVMFNGFDVNKYMPDSEKYENFRKGNLLSHDANIIGMLARYNPVKNHKLFIDIARKVKEKYPEAVFLMAGLGVTVSNSDIVSWLNNANLIDDVILLGEVNSRDVLPVLDCLVSTSVAEGFPNIVGEAMLCGVPCVVSDVGESKYLVDDCGYVCDVRDIDKYVNSISHILDQSYSDKNESAERNRKRITDTFPFQSMKKTFFDIIEVSENS